MTILEVGSWAGASLAAWDSAARGLAKLIVVDSWKPYFAHGGEPYDVMTRAAESGEIFELFKRNIAACQIADRVEINRGDSRVVLPALARRLAGAVDLVFVDGDHSYEAVRADLENAMPLMRDGGILCGDDWERKLEDVRDLEAHRRAVAAGVDVLGDYHPGVTQAVADVFGRASWFDGLWAVRLRKDRWEEVVLA